MTDQKSAQPSQTSPSAFLKSYSGATSGGTSDTHLASWLDVLVDNEGGDQLFDSMDYQFQMRANANEGHTNTPRHLDMICELSEPTCHVHLTRIWITRGVRNAFIPVHEAVERHRLNTMSALVPSWNRNTSGLASRYKVRRMQYTWNVLRIRASCASLRSSCGAVPTGALCVRMSSAFLNEMEISRPVNLRVPASLIASSQCLTIKTTQPMSSSCTSHDGLMLWADMANDGTDRRNACYESDRTRVQSRLNAVQRSSSPKLKRLKARCRPSPAQGRMYIAVRVHCSSGDIPFIMQGTRLHAAP
ncbi:hypothetical protein BKA93DRAFT_751536 [Sparassis latifolia]